MATLLQHVPTSGKNLMRLPKAPGTRPIKVSQAPGDWIICGKQAQKRFSNCSKKAQALVWAGIDGSVGSVGT